MVTQTFRDSHTVELGSRQWCRLTLVVRLWPRHRSELALGMLPES